MRHDCRATTENGVTGDERTIGDEVEGQRIGRVPRSRHHREQEPTSLDQVTAGEPFVAEPVRRVESGHGSADSLG